MKVSAQRKPAGERPAKRSEVDRALKSLREFYDEGRRDLEEHPVRVYGRFVRHAKEGRLGEAELLRKARALAGAYSPRASSSASSAGTGNATSQARLIARR
jgi:hypothetical protein